MNSMELAGRLRRSGGAIGRWSLVAFFLGWGLAKFTAGEAAAIDPLTEHSLLLFWVDPLFGKQGGSDFIGVVEIALAGLIALRHLSPRLSAVGSLGAAFALLNTLSFLFTTPGLQLQSLMAYFIMKDLGLLGIAFWSAGEALAVERTHETGAGRRACAPSDRAHPDALATASFLEGSIQ